MQREGRDVTTKEKSIKPIKALPEDTSRGDIVEELRHLEPGVTGAAAAAQDSPPSFSDLLTETVATGP